MSANLKKLTSLINKSRTIVIFINQIREKPAVKFGSPETTPGGRALKFYSSMRIRVAKKDALYEGSTNMIGHRMKLTIKKNKVAPPFQSTEIDLYYRDSEPKGKKAGFDIFSDTIETAKAMGIIELRGSSYNYVNQETGEVHKASGLVKWKAYLEEHPEVMQEITDEIIGVSSDDSKQEE